MRLEAKKYLYDVQGAAALIGAFTASKTLDDYSTDALLRSAVERQFEIIGEALSQLHKLDPALATRIREHQRIIAFRNVLIHGYAQVDDRLVWDLLDAKLPALRDDVETLLSTA